MNVKNLLTATVLTATSVVAAAAPIAYEGVLVPSVPVTGNVGGFSYFLETAASWTSGGSPALPARL
jgi:hypothetical protein